MGKSEILAELSKLAPEERKQIYDRLCELQEQDLLAGVGPSDQEKRILDEALDEYTRDRDRGRPWREILRDLRASGAR